MIAIFLGVVVVVAAAVLTGLIVAGAAHVAGLALIVLGLVAVVELHYVASLWRGHR